MKNLLKATILLLIVMYASIISVYAAETNVTLRPSSSNVKVGETVSIDVVVSSATGIEALDSTLKYDTNKLELVNTSVDKDFKDVSGKNEKTGDYKLSFLYDKTEKITEVTIVKLDFKVLDTAKVDDVLKVTLSDIDVNDSDDEWIDVADKEAQLKIIKSVATEPEKDNTQSDKEHEHAGLEDYTFAIIAGAVIIAVISYIKYKKYGNI